MDKKLLDALNNLSLGLELLVETLDEKGKRTKSAIETALKSQDLDKKFSLLSKSIQSLTEINKSLVDGNNNTIRLLEEQSKKINVLQSSVKTTTTKPSEVTQEIAESQPQQEISAVSTSSKPNLPELAKVEQQIIPLKYGEVPTLPELAKVEEQIIPLKYGEVPTLPEMAKIDAQEVPVKFGELSKLDVKDTIEEQTIPVKWGDIPTLPEIAKISEQIIPMRWGSVPNPPNIPDPNPVTIDLEYGKIGKFKAPKPDKVLIPTEYEEPKNKAAIQRPPQRTIDEQAKENPLGSSVDGNKNKEIKDGVAMVMMIAVAVLAIGMAFKLIGGVNVATVLSLAVAIPILALAFSEVSKNKELTAKRAIELIGVLAAMATALVITSLILKGVAPIGIMQIMSSIAIAGIFTVLSFGLGQMVEAVQGLGNNATKSLLMLPIIMPAISLAILLSSYILSAVSPLGGAQIISSIAIAGVFFVLGYGIKSLVDAVSGLGTNSLKALVIMPLVLTALSLSIMLSSYVLSAVAPVGILQLFTAVMIAGVFTVLAYGLGQIFQGLSSFGIRSLILLPFLPLIFVSLALSIALSSYVLAMVRPVGILQLFTAIMIAGVFAVIGFGLGKILSGMKELKNPAMAALIAVALPILLVAIAAAITASSYLFATIKPISFPQFITAVGISIIFIPMAFALKFIAKAIEGVSLVRVALLPIIMVAMALTIQLTSEIFAKVVPLPFSTLLSIVLLTVTMAVVGFVLGFAFKFLGRLSIGTIVRGGLTMLMIAGVIMATSKILAKGEYTKFPSFEWSLKTGLAILVIGAAVVALGLIATSGGAAAIPVGIVAMLALAVTIVAVAKILGKGTYNAFPPYEWSKAVGLSIGIFGVATLTLGGLILGTLGLGGAALAAGSAGVLMIAETIVKAADILSKGTFTGGPKKEWAEGVGIALGAFSPVYGMMLKNKIFELFGGGGMGPEEFSKSIVTLTTAIVEASKIIKSGTFTGGPKKEWAEGVAIAIGGFSKVYQMMLINGIAGFFGGGGMGPEEFSKAVVSISTAIKESSIILKLGTYEGGPKKEWSEGVALAIGGFSKVYQMLLINGIAGFFGGGGMGPDEFSKAIVAISTAIRDSSFILRDGTYVGAPTKDWAEGVAIAIGGFSKVYQMLLINGIAGFFGGGGMGPEEFSKSIVAISTAIRDSSYVLLEGTYEGAPTKEWAEGVAVAIGGFSKVYQMLLTNGIAGFFGGGGMGPMEFSTAIVAISTAIRDSSFILREGTYEGAPSKEWAEGVSLGIGGFSQVYSMLMKNAIMKMFGGGGMGPEEFATAIGSVSEGLLVASEKLSQGKFVGGPTKQWSEGVALGIGGFSQVYSMMMKNSIMEMFGGGGIGPKEFGEAIGVVSEGLLVASEKLSQGKFTGGPTKKWSEGVAAGIAGFSTVYSMMMKNSFFEVFGMSGLKPDDFAKSIEVISAGIMKASESLSKGSYTGGPTKKWSEGIGLAIGEFSKIYDYLSGNFFSKLFGGGPIDPKAFVSAIDTVAQGINTAAGRISGPFPKGPTKEWAEGTSIAFGEFSKIYDYLSGDFITNFLRGGAINPKKFVETINTVADGINVASKKIQGPFPKGPSKEWAEGTSIAFGEFSKIYDYLSGDFITNFLRGGAIKPEKFVQTIQTVAQGINVAAKIIEGPFPVGPNKEWAQGMSIAFGEFSKIYDYFSGNFITNFLRGGAIDPENFVKTIQTVGVGINIAAKTIEGPFPVGPDKEWAQGISTAFGEFSKIYDYFSGNFITNFLRGGGIDPEKFVETIQVVASGINVAAKTIQGPFPAGPTKEWAMGISTAFGEFSKIYSYLSGDIIDRLFGRGEINPEKFVNAIITVAEGINVAAKTIQGPFPEGPDKKWAQGMSTAFGEFSKIYTYLSGDIIDRLFGRGEIKPDKFVNAIITVADGINVAAKKISGPFPAGPSKEWAQGISVAFGEFSKIYSYLNGDIIDRWFGRGEIDAQKFATSIGIVAEGINTAATKISGPFPTGPTKEWAQGISLAFGEFSKIYSYLNGDVIDRWFGRGKIDAQKFATSIEIVAGGINTAASKISGPFPTGPSKEWAQGISLAFGEFSRIYTYLSGDIIDRLFGRGEIDPTKFSNAIKIVAMGINAAAHEVKGPFPDGPKKEWAESIATSFTAFSKIYTYLNGDLIDKFFGRGEIDPTKFSNAIKTVAMGVNAAAGEIKGPFPMGPSKNWATGISIAFGEFTKIYDYLSGGFLDKVLGRGPIKAEEFVKTIDVVAAGVNVAAQKIKGPFPEGPSKEWAEGMAISFGEFTKIYDYLSGGFMDRILGRGKINPTEFVTTIQVVADGINEAAKKIKGPFPEGPSKEWAEGMSTALGAFTQMYDYLSPNFMTKLFGGKGTDPKVFVQTIQTVSEGINTASMMIKGPFPEGPSREWASGMSLALGAFTQMYDYLSPNFLSKLFGGSGTDPQQFVQTIQTVSDGINTASKMIKGPFPEGPKKEWADGIATSFGAFSKMYDYFQGGFWSGGAKDPTSFVNAIDTVAIGINTASKRIVGPFPKGPDKSWAEGIAISFGAFSEMYDFFSPGFLKDEIDPNDFTNAIDIVANGINVASKRIKGPFPAGPTQEWAKATALAFGEFSKMYEFIGDNEVSADEFAFSIEAIAAGINVASKKIEGPFPEGPSKEWAESTSRAFGEFSKIYNYFSGGWFKDAIDPYQFVSVIGTIAEGISVAASKIKGPFPEGPDEKWSEGISRSFGAFSKMYDYFKETWFSDEVDSDQFNNVIVTVAEAMNTAGGKIKGPFNEGPDKSWSQSIAETFGAFSQIYDYMSGSWFSKPIDADEFQKVIITVAEAMTLASSKIGGTYKNAPGKEWAKGVATTFGAFSEIYDYMAGGWFSKPVDPDLFQQVIVTVATAMNTAGGSLKGPWKEGPGVEWADSISRTFGVFTNLYDYFSKGFITKFLSGAPKPDQFSKDIVTIATAINTASSTIKGPYTEPPTVDWSERVSKSFGVFTNLYDYFSKGFIGKFLSGAPKPDQFSKDIVTIATAINTASSTIKGPFTEPPTVDWSERVSKSFGVFTNLYDYFSKGFISKFLSGAPDPTKFSTDIQTIAAGINAAAASIKGPYKEGPKKEWSESVAAAFGTFTDIYDYFNDQWLSSDIDPEDFKKTIQTIADGINTAAASIKGPYKEGPKKEWSEGVALAFGAFTDIYDYLNDQWFSSDINPTEFNTTIETIANGIIKAANILGGTDKYPLGPSKTWAEAVSISFGAFSQIFDYLNDQTFSSDIDPDDFVKTIEIIAKGIVSAAGILGGEDKYPVGPSEPWARSVALSFGAFSKIYESLSGGWFKSAIDPETWCTAIETIAKGIISAAKVLGGKDAIEAYKNGPPKTWSEGIAASFGAFTGIFTALNKDSSWFSGTKDYNYYGKAIESVGQGLVDAAKLIGGDDVSYDLNKIPKKEWSEAIRITFQNFLPALKYISDSEGWISSGSGKLLSNMQAIAESIKNTDDIISEGSYETIIDKKWYTNLRETLSIFTSTVATLAKDKPDWDLMEEASNAIVDNSNILKDTKFNVIIDKNWSAATKLVMNDFIYIVKEITKIPENADWNKLRDITNNIVWVSNVIQRGSYGFVIPDTWSSATKLSIYDFVNVLKKVNEVPENAYNQLRNVGNNLVWVSKIIGRGQYNTIIPEEWLYGTKNTFYQFAYLLRNISGIKDDAFNILRNMGNNLVWVSRILPRGLYTFSIPTPWLDNVKDTFFRFRNAIVISTSVQPKQIQSSKALSMSIQQNSLILAKGKYSTKIPKEYTTSVLDAYKSFAEVLSNMKKSGLLESIGPETVTKSEYISKVIASVANYFNSAAIDFDEDKMPSASWASGFSSTVTALIPGVDLIEELSDGGADGAQKFSDNVTTITKSILEVATQFAGLTLPPKTKTIPDDYFEGISKAIDSYMKIQDSLRGMVSLDSKKVKEDIGALKNIYDALATSLDKLALSTSKIDVEKLKILSGISSSVISVSTVNPDSLKQVLELLINQYPKAIDKIGKSSENAQVPPNIVPVVNTTPNVNVSNAGANSTPQGDMGQLKIAMEGLAASIASISALLGKPSDAKSTLAAYIEHKMKPENKSNKMGEVTGANTPK